MECYLENGKEEEIKAKAALAEQKQGTRTVETKIGIAYDSVLKQPCKDGQFRRTLDNKTVFVSFDCASNFECNKEGVIAGRYAMNKIELRTRNGDGAV